MQPAGSTITATEPNSPQESGGVKPSRKSGRKPGKGKIGRLSKEEWYEFQRMSKVPNKVPRPEIHAISVENAAELDKTALKLRLEPLDATALKVRNTLGLPKEKWNRAKMKSIQELGMYEHMRICARVLLITDFSCIDQIEQAIKVGSEMLQNKELAKEDRISAGVMISKCAQALRDLGKEAMGLAERSDQKKEPAAKRKNLPPQIIVPVQVNVAGAPSPVPAIPVSTSRVP